ncbi:RNA-directed DNA polymerase, eukaryota, reverse transcriptase zinc-binding domain protein [Tanacetum coccineum]
MVVSSNQSAFIPGRNIQDNILLIQEIMKGYNRKGGPKRVAIKIDLQKAYDTISWKFLEKSQSIKLVHVSFADDLLVMWHGDSNYVKVIKRALDEFNACSWLLPNNSKSTMFFGSLNKDEKNAILSVLPFATGKLPVRYLGVPLIAKRLSVKDCGCLLDKIKRKVKNWKNRSLSYADRLQLIAAVLESIHVYWASVFLIPTTIINEINSLLKWFLWNQRETAAGKAKVAWKDI